MRRGSEQRERREGGVEIEGRGTEEREKASELSSHPVVHTNMACGETVKQ